MNSKLANLHSFRFDLALKLDLGQGKLPPAATKDDQDLQDFVSQLVGFFSDVKMQGAFAAPDQLQIDMNFGGEQAGFVQIGDKGWVKTNGAWDKASPEDMVDFKTASPISSLGNPLPPDLLKRAKVSKENMNGLSTTHYAYDRGTIVSIIDPSGKNSADLKPLTNAAYDLWLAEGDLPVKMIIDIAGRSDDGTKSSWHFEMNLKDVNSDIKIKPPV